MSARGLSQSDFARMAGVSRQAVSKWFSRGEKAIRLHSDTLVKLAKGLQVSVEDLTEPLPLVGMEEGRTAETELLWDGLFRDLVSFSVALIRKDPRALGRLVQVYGLHQAEKVAGREVWKSFPKYKRFIEPRQRERWEQVWNLKNSRALR
jgi:transcriptional regulator with XRE-family HTH domain